MDKRSRQTRLVSSSLFTVRIWREIVGENQQEWRGQVEHVLSGKAGYFRGWPMLITFLEEAFAAQEPDGAAEKAEHEPGADQGTERVP